MQVLPGHAKHVGFGHGAQRLPVLEDEVVRVAVVAVAEHPRQGLGRRIEVEYEAVQAGLFGRLQLLAGHLGGANPVDLLAHHPNRFRGGSGFRAPADLEQARMVVCGSPFRADAVGVTELGADALEKAARKASAQDIGHDFECGVVLVPQDAAELSHGEYRLGHVLLQGQEDARVRPFPHSRKGRDGRLRVIPAAKQSFEFLFHGRGREIAVDRQQDIGREEVAPVEGNQVAALDASQGGVLDLAAVGRVFAVHDVTELAPGDDFRIVVAAGDLVAELRLAEVDSLLAEGGLGQHVMKDGQNVVGILAERGEADLAGGLFDRALDRGRDVLQVLVEPIAGAGLGATGTHDHTGQGRQPDLIGRIEQVSRAHQRQAVHQRQIVVLEQVDPQAAGQRECLDVRDLQRRERRKLEAGRRLRQERRGEQEKHSEPPSHCAPPFGATVKATVRPLATKYSAATRRTSAVVILSMSSRAVNIFLQPP